MIRWHSLLQAHIAEYLVLHSFVSTHLSTDAQTLKKDLNTETFFNKFLEGFIQSVRVVLFMAALVYWDVLIFFRCACSPLVAYERSENENRHH
jgi:hypothetical protein